MTPEEILAQHGRVIEFVGRGSRAAAAAKRNRQLARPLRKPRPRFPMRRSRCGSPGVMPAICASSQPGIDGSFGTANIGSLRRRYAPGTSPAKCVVKPPRNATRARPPARSPAPRRSMPSSAWPVRIDGLRRPSTNGTPIPGFSIRLTAPLTCEPGRPVRIAPKTTRPRSRQSAREPMRRVYRLPRTNSRR